jgi:hypothetical protein
MAQLRWVTNPTSQNNKTWTTRQNYGIAETGGTLVAGFVLLVASELQFYLLQLCEKSGLMINLIFL